MTCGVIMAEESADNISAPLPNKPVIESFSVANSRCGRTTSGYFSKTPRPTRLPPGAVCSCPIPVPGGMFKPDRVELIRRKADSVRARTDSELLGIV